VPSSLTEGPTGIPGEASRPDIGAKPDILEHLIM